VKVPFSYRHQQFRSVLAASVLGHFLFIGAGSGITGTPQYSVRQAPTSMEVLLIPEKPDLPKPEQARVLAAKDTPSKDKIRVSKEPEPLRKKKIEKPVYQPEVKGAVSEPRPDSFQNKPPVYPEFAREQGWEGLVLLKVFVRSDGAAASVKIIRGSGYQMLDGAALRAVKAWRFLPARLGGLPYASTVKIPVRFVLTDAPQPYGRGRIAQNYKFCAANSPSAT
jgi:TonB family protein